MKDKIFYVVCFGVIFGVLIRSLVAMDSLFVGALLTITFCILLFFIFISKNKWGIVGSVFVLFVMLGILRFSLHENFTQRWYEKEVGSTVESEGLIIDEPDIRENNQKLVVEEDISGMVTKFLVTANLDQDFKYGDMVSFKGKVEKPENFITDTGKEFDYVNYLGKDGLFYTINYADVTVISSGHGNFIKSFLFSIKEKFLAKMNKAISPPESLLMGGLILGEKSAFSQDLRQEFVDTGIIHIVALSGYNVTIVADWIMKLFKQIPFISKGVGIYAGIISIILFILMTGASSTAIRAGIMSTLALVARATGRNYDVARALTLAAFGMILINPMTLVYDVSFQLSFMATIAVIFLTPRIEKHFMWVPKTLGLREIISVTSAAYLFVFPFILYKMGNFSLVALPANIMILPFIPTTMLFGFLTGFAGFFHPFLSLPFGYISYWLLHYELTAISFFARLPFAAFSISNFPLWLTVMIYIYFIYKLFGRSIKKFFEDEATVQLESSPQ